MNKAKLNGKFMYHAKIRTICTMVKKQLNFAEEVEKTSSKLPFFRIAISRMRRTRPVIGSVKIFVSRLPSTYKIELQFAVHQTIIRRLDNLKGNRKQKYENID